MDHVRALLSQTVDNIGKAITEGDVACDAQKSDPVWLKNSAGSRRIAIVVAQQPAKALASLHLTMVAP